MFHDNSVHYQVYHVAVKHGLSKDCRSLKIMNVCGDTHMTSHPLPLSA